MKNKKNIGVFVGKFLPPHIGHLNQIKKCLDECDELYVVVADSEERSEKICKKAGIETIYAKTRLKWLKMYFKDNKRIKFLLLNQGMLEAYPDKLEEWKIKFKNITKNKFNIWFVDKNFLEISEKYFPEYKFIGFDRSEINISATDIRKDFEKNKKYIIPQAKIKFIEKITTNN